MKLLLTELIQNNYFFIYNNIMSNVQTVVFLRDKGWTKSKAEKYLRDNNYKTTFYGKGVDTKFNNQLRYRQLAPSKFKDYITKKKRNGIMFIIGVTNNKINNKK